MNFTKFGLALETTRSTVTNLAKETHTPWAMPHTCIFQGE